MFDETTCQHVPLYLSPHDQCAGRNMSVTFHASRFTFHASHLSPSLLTFTHQRTNFLCDRLQRHFRCLLLRDDSEDRVVQQIFGF